MARSQRRFRGKYNESLHWLESGGEIKSVSQLAQHLNTSRTTARAIIQQLTTTGIVDETGQRLTRGIVDQDYYPLNDVMETREILRKDCMNWIMKEKFIPGSILDEVLIATRLKIPVSSVHDFLVSLSQFGFIKRVKNREWLVEPISHEFINQVLELRRILELQSIAPLIRLPANNVFWSKLAHIYQDHKKQLSDNNGEALAFFELDNRLHSLLTSASNNRLMTIFEDAVFFIFFYHYQWGKKSEESRNLQAMKEHVSLIESLLEKDEAKAKKHLESHLNSAQQTLIHSVIREKYI